MVERALKVEASFINKAIKTLNYHAFRTLRHMRGLYWDMTYGDSVSPVFVLGCSRAGTTLVYKILSESAVLGSLNRETHDFWSSLHPLEERNWDTHAISECNATRTERKKIERYFYTYTGMKNFVDKNNQNGLCVPYLTELFPQARFVYVKRSPGDNINSLIEGWNRPDEFSTWSLSMREKVAIEHGKYTRWCFFLSEGWRDYLSKSIEEVCAFQYMAMNREIMAAKHAVSSSQWYELKYEDILSNLDGAFKQIFTALNLDYDSSTRARCLDAAAVPYNAFSAIRVDKWKEGRNANKVDAVLERTTDLAEAMGYSSSS